MNGLVVKKPGTAMWDAASLGEIMLRLEDFMLQGGVDTSHVHWAKFDGIGREVRNGLNFVERGFGCRGARSGGGRGGAEGAVSVTFK